MKEILKRIKLGIFSIDSAFLILITAIYCIVFMRIVLLSITSDILAHAWLTAEMAVGNLPWAGNFLYYMLIYVLNGYETYIYDLAFCGAIVLFVISTAKYVIIRGIFKELLPNITKLHINILSILLCIAFSFSTDGKNYYLGQIPPNIWHNSTTIFLMPFALLLFWTSYLQLTDYKARRNFYILLLIILNVIAKPSYLFVYSVVFPIASLAIHGIKSKKFWFNSMTVVFGMVLIYIQYLVIYNPTTTSGGIGIAMFKVWQLFSNNILLSTLLSTLFPFTVLLLYFKEFKQDIFAKYSYLSFAISLLFFILLFEDNERFSHGNFIWQSIVCSFFMFASAIVLMVRNQNNGNKLRFYISYFLLLAHFISGIYYIYRILFLFNIY